MQDIMLDLETMSTEPNAAIIAIGAVEMDFLARVLGREFYMVVSLKSSVESGGLIDADTVLWWMRQSDAARSAFTSGEAQPLAHALASFTEFVQDAQPSGVPRKPLIWGNGAAFDNVILRSAYTRLDMPCPWEYRDDRCYRTLKALRPDTHALPSLVKHHALEDAKAQALHLIEMLR